MSAKDKTGDRVSSAQQLISKKRLANRWDVCERTIDRLIERGQCPRPIAFNQRMIRFKLDEIIAHENALKG